MPPWTGETADIRFWSHVERGEFDACWPWTSYTSGRQSCRYGCFWVRSGELGVPEGFVDGTGHRGKRMSAHRVAFFFVWGRWPDPEGLHGCDNPLCCNAENIEHVHEGTQQENVLEMIARSREVRNPVRGAKNALAKLTSAQVREIRERKAAGEQQRALAREFEVSDTTVSHLVRGIVYGDVR